MMNKGKLSRETFVYGMEYLNAYYTLLKIDLDNKLQVKVWYEALSHIEDNTFTFMVKSYCKENQFPPQSPTHLTHKLDELMELEAISVRDEIRMLKEKHTKIEFSVVESRTVAMVDWEKVLENATPNAQKVINGVSGKGYESFTEKEIKRLLFNNDDGIKLLTQENEDK